MYISNINYSDHFVVGMQVSHCGKPIEGGFSSGATLPCPSSFMHQFDKPGLYYYKRYYMHLNY